MTLLPSLPLSLSLSFSVSFLFSQDGALYPVCINKGERDQERGEERGALGLGREGVVVRLGGDQG